ncbi:teichuronopeptide biosynthesis TupA-like protein [Paraburkholderia sp. BL23I1N1]|uniref:ATP-grasp fold amidoligase family protein n=1 Tax=Paraburkholderia sp. BL23I1N1 TaxID=1938802 RepID=UPI000E72502B|nr:ATP-grasp fold amidoligase family protein [Paraburkholderia sp. BL23I1N1]RKE37022.1 teichuronopeptide biosynthesis TupA-like protein [Paraburkholderia sp. BL23I1N1]
MPTSKSAPFEQEIATSTPEDPCRPTQQSVSVVRRLKEAAKCMLPDSVFVSLLHHKCIGRYPNLLRPATFNEKILQRSLSPDPRYISLTDKLSVREYVAAKIGERHLIPLISAPDVLTREVFDALPDSFVMKANHGSSFVEVVRNKSETSFETLQLLAAQWLSTDFYYIAREKHYRTIKPRIFFEQLLLDQSGQIPADYKLHCFGGRPGRPIIYILVISNRFGSATHGDVYDVDWNHLDVAIGHYKRSAAPAPRPNNLESVLDTAVTLCEDFDYVRVDLYAPDNQVFFGELTFTPGAGVLPFTPDSIDYEWGKLLS